MNRPIALAFIAACLSTGLSRPSGAGSRSPQTPRPGDEAAHAAHAVPIETLPIVVDGAKNPEKIPMELAYRHLIGALAGPRAEREESADLLSRRRTHAQRMGLSGEDQAAIVAAVRGLGDELNSIERTRRSAVSDGLTVDLPALRAQERTLLDGARVRIGHGLTIDGAARLERYVREHVRRRITIYGDLPQ